MSFEIRSLAFAAVLGALLAGTPAAADSTCPEGMVAGQCVSPSLAQMARQGAVIRTQVRLSISNRNYAPSLDWEFSYPNSVVGAQSYNSELGGKPGLVPTLHSPAYLIYGIHN